MRDEDFLEQPVDTFLALASFLRMDHDPAALRTGLCAELKRHHYETFAEPTDKSPNRVEHYFGHVLSDLGRWRFNDYWKDNLYKARLRLARF